MENAISLKWVLLRFIRILKERGRTLTTFLRDLGRVQCLTRVTLLGITLAAVDGRQAAQAAETTADGPGSVQLDEIVVTAEKRSQALQDVPIALSAIQGADLESRGAQGFADYIRSIAGVSFVDRGPTENQIIIRGITNGPFSPGEPTTAVYIDETPVTQSNRSADLNPFDVSRIEVLRGPQGTLYGNASMGGTVRIILNKPDPHAVAFAADGTFLNTTNGSNGFALNSMANLPLVADRLAVRLVGYDREDPGFIRNVALGLNNVNTAHTSGGRLMLGLYPSDRLNIQAGVAYQAATAGGRPQEDLNLPVLQQFRLFPENIENNWWRYNLDVTYDFGWANLVSATSYYTMRARNGLDISLFGANELGLALTAGGFPTLAVGLNSANKFIATVQEIRLASAEGTALHWLVGAYYSDQRNHAPQVGVLPAALNLALPLLDTVVDNSTRQYAGFGEISYLAANGLQATLGARVFKIDYGRTSFEGPDVEDGGTPSSAAGSAAESSHNMKYNLSYKLSPAKLLYVQAAQGFRVGGVNAPIPGDQTGFRPDYRSDSLWTYELGSKNTLWDNKLLLNLAVYRSDWNNIQVEATTPTGFNYIANAGSARVKGAEAEIQLRPLRGLDLTSSASYTDATLLNPGNGGVGIAGQSLPNIPRWSANAAAQYSWPMGQLSGYGRAEYQYVGSSLSDFLGSGFVKDQPAYSLVNLRVGIRSGTWEAAVFVDNLTNRIAQIWARELGSANLGTETSVVTRPRTIGVNLRYAP